MFLSSPKRIITICFVYVVVLPISLIMRENFILGIETCEKNFYCNLIFEPIYLMVKFGNFYQKCVETGSQVSLSLILLLSFVMSVMKHHNCFSFKTFHHHFSFHSVTPHSYPDFSPDYEDLWRVCFESLFNHYTYRCTIITHTSLRMLIHQFSKSLCQKTSSELFHIAYNEIQT